MIGFQIAYFFWCIVFAGVNAQWIKNHGHVPHFFNGCAHLLAASYAWFHFGRWEVFLIILCNARLVFSTVLNVFRGLDWDYVSPEPKAKTDQFEKWAFGNDGWIAFLFYLVITIICNASYFQHANN